MKGKVNQTRTKHLPGLPHALRLDNPTRSRGNALGRHIEGKKPTVRADKRARGGGIHIKKAHKGLLHKDTDTPAGKKISAKKLEKAEHSSNPKVRKRAVFAENAKHWNHG